MRFLGKKGINQVVTHFKITCELPLESSTPIKPDVFLYRLIDKTGNKDGLLCRDYMQDDTSIETRILSQEQNLIVLNWINPIDHRNDYQVFVKNLDSFVYISALFKYEEKL